MKLEICRSVWVLVGIGAMAGAAIAQQASPAADAAVAQQVPAPAPQAAPDAAPASPAAQKDSNGADAGVDDSYVIGPSDVLNVNVMRQQSLTGSALVRPDGMITINLIGDVKAAGKTPPVLAGEIAERLKKYVQDPNVTVTLNEMNSKYITLTGEIGKQGHVKLTMGMTLVEAVADSGGLTVFANTKKMYILRKENGKQNRIPVNYKAALQGDAAADIPLKSGDTIVVP